MKSKNEIGNLELFVVKNSEGKFFRAKGYGGYGETWVDAVAKARIYAKLTGARTIVSFFANNYPDYPPPVIVKMTVAESEILDETERLQKIKERRQKMAETKELREKASQLERAKAELEAAQSFWVCLPKRDAFSSASQDSTSHIRL